MPLDSERTDLATSTPIDTFRKSAGGSAGPWMILALGSIWFAYTLLENAVSTDLSLMEQVFGLALPLIIASSGCVLLIRQAPGRVDTLTLDERGVSILEGSRRRFFAWAEISRVRKYLDGDPESPTEVVAIEKKGELIYVPSIGDIRGFPLPADELVELIRHRKALADTAASLPSADDAVR